MANTRQSVIKHVLTEGDRIVVGKISPLGDQGGYAIAINYGISLFHIRIYEVCKLIDRLLDRPNRIPTPGRNPATPFLPFSQFSPDPTSPHVHHPYLLTSPLIPPSILTANITNHTTPPPSRKVSTNHRPRYVGSIFNILHPAYELEWNPGGVSCFLSFSRSNCETGEMDDWIKCVFCGWIMGTQ